MNRVAGAVVGEATAWELIGHDEGPWLRVKGGRALYESAIYYDDTPGTQVRLVRLDTAGGALRQVGRYVHPDTIIELVQLEEVA